MNALMKKEDSMSVEDRLAGLESDVKYLRKDMGDAKQDIKSLDNGIQNLRADVQSFKTEVAKEFGLVRAAAEAQRADTHREFGSVHVAIESLKTSIEKAKLWTLVTGVATTLSAVVTLAHALKLF